MSAATVVRLVKHGPCGICKESKPRDDLFGVSVKFYDGDKVRQRVSLRLCEECCGIFEDRMISSEWDNSKMTLEEVSI